MQEPKSKYLEINMAFGEKGSLGYWILVNKQQQEIVGYIKRRRLGKFMHWCLEPEPETYFSNGCLKEISKFITELYSKKESLFKKIFSNKMVKTQ
jgi:hypothetical protein